MTHPEEVEVLILGSGMAGKHLAWYMAEAGHRTAIIERRWIGGSCPNINCLPSKNEIKSAEVASIVAHAPPFGTEVDGVRRDMTKVLARKRRMVEGEVAFHLERFRQTGTELLQGQARFVAPRTVEVKLNDGDTRRITGERVYLNLGSRPFIPPIPGLASTALTNIELLELDRLPDHLVVLGGGYVSVELAQAYRRFGSRVTLVERGQRLLSLEDAEVSEALQRLFEDEGMEVLVGAQPVRVDRGRGGELSVVLETGTGDRALVASDVLAALGRTPNTDGIGLDVAGVQLDPRGYIAVNERLETSAPSVWALGDCAGSPQFTHVSFDDFRIVRDNFEGKRRAARGRLVPFCVFTNPQLARVGLTESEARQRGIAVRVATLPMEEILRTHTTGETRGFMKTVVDARTDDILGFTMFGADAGEVMAVVQTAMLAGLPFTGLRDAVIAHPTMAEGLNGLFARIPAHDLMLGTSGAGRGS